MKNYLIGTLIWVVIINFLRGPAYGGILSTEPPAEFLNLETCAGYSRYACTLREFVDNAFESNTRHNWTRDSDNGWVLIVQGVDPVSGSKKRMAFAFEKAQNEKGSFAKPTRINTNGQEIPPTVIPNIYIPLIDGVGKTLGKVATSPGEPSHSFLALKVKIPTDESSVYPFTVKDVVNYLKQDGSTITWEAKIPVYVLHVDKKGKQQNISISEQPVFTKPESTGAFISGPKTRELLNQIEAHLSSGRQ